MKSRPKLNLGFIFRVCSGFTFVNSEWTQRVNSEKKQEFQAIRCLLDKRRTCTLNCVKWTQKQTSYKPKVNPKCMQFYKRQNRCKPRVNLKVNLGYSQGLFCCQVGSLSVMYVCRFREACHLLQIKSLSVKLQILMYESRLTLKKNIDWKDTDRSFENYFDLVVKLRFSERHRE